MPRKAATTMQRRIIGDAEGDSIIFRGATLTQLAKLFRMDLRTVKGKLADVKPVGRVGPSDIWSVKEAAAYLVKPIGDFHHALRTMNADDLPPMLRKEYWSAMRQEQEFKKEAGQLWATEDVLAAFSETFKEFRTELLLLGGAVEREVQLSDRAREIIQSNIDVCMGNIRERLITKFGAPDPDAPPPPEVTSDDDIDADLEGLDLPEEDDEDEFSGL